MLFPTEVVRPMEMKQYIISENTTIREAMRIVDARSGSNLFVCRDGILQASVSDGDIRRYMLINGDLEMPVSHIANYKPIYLYTYDDIKQSRSIMENHGINALPIVTADMRLVQIEFLKKPVVHVQPLHMPVVIMAGGKGTRLQPYTQILPKPLIPVGNVTITEHIMTKFEEYDCRHFDMIVNYKKNLIKSYFQDNEISHDISFVEEPEFWGTAGGLKLLQGKYQGTFFVTNCDIVVEADYADIYRYHRERGNIISLVCARKRTVIPYGTVEVNEQNEIISLKEKPEYEFLTNTGLYLVEPEFLDYIPENTFIHITDVVQKCMAEHRKVGTYIIEENAWMDMGQLEALEQMQTRMRKDSH